MQDIRNHVCTQEWNAISLPNTRNRTHSKQEKQQSLQVWH
jgi:hypothetical protein